MSTVGIVVLCIVGGLFLITIGFLLYSVDKTEKDTKRTTDTGGSTAFSCDTDKSCADGGGAAADSGGGGGDGGGGG